MGALFLQARHWVLGAGGGRRRAPPAQRCLVRVRTPCSFQVLINRFTHETQVPRLRIEPGMQLQPQMNND